MKKSIKIFIIMSLVLANLFLFMESVSLKKVVDSNSFYQNRTLISAHRGGAFLNPENTKKAFDYIIFETDYVDIVEIDVRLTKDNIIVINHDSDINRMALSKGEESISIDSHTYNELQNYNLGKNFVNLNNEKPYFDYSIEQAKENGLTIMSLEDFLSRYKEHREIKLFLEIKESGSKGEYIASEVYNMINVDYSWWKDRTMIITFNDELIDYIAGEYPKQYIGALGDKVVEQIVYNKLGLDVFYKPNFHGIHIPMNEKVQNIKDILISKGIVSEAHERNQLVIYWGVNEETYMKELIDIGVDVITTDVPNLLAKVLGRI